MSEYRPNETAAWEAAYVVFERIVGNLLPPFTLSVSSLGMKNFAVEVVMEFQKRLGAAPDPAEKLLRVAECARVVMAYLERDGGSIVPHLLDDDENPGKRLRDALAALKETP